MLPCLCRYRRVLRSVGIGLWLACGWLISCGEDSSTTTTVADFPPQITQLVFPDQVISGVEFPVAHGVSVPGGLPTTDMAVQLSWSFPEGPIIVAQRFSAAEVGCLAGAITCSAQFNTQAPADLTVFNTAYEVVFAVFDRQGRRAEAVRLTSLIAP